MHDSNILMRHQNILCRTQKSDVSANLRSQILELACATTQFAVFHCIFTVFTVFSLQFSLHFSAQKMRIGTSFYIGSFVFFLHFFLRWPSHHNISIQSITFCMVLYKLKQTDNTTNLYLSSFCVQPVSTYMCVMDSLLVIMT